MDLGNKLKYLQYKKSDVDFNSTILCFRKYLTEKVLLKFFKKSMSKIASQTGIKQSTFDIYIKMHYTSRCFIVSDIKFPMKKSIVELKGCHDHNKNIKH